MVISNPESVEKVSRPAWDLTLEKQNTIDNLKEIKVLCGEKERCQI